MVVATTLRQTVTARSRDIIIKIKMLAMPRRLTP